VRTAWVVHRALYSITGGRFGLRRPKERRWGMLRLSTVGRRSGKPRNVTVAYYEDGPNLMLMAMNGWAEPDPAWWLNLQSRPDASVSLPGGESRRVRARVATDEERARLLPRWNADTGEFDRYSALRSRRTELVILEPRS
jgi:deazaflavin-dependent oxidoreductase (nitroreductase family)